MARSGLYKSDVQRARDRLRATGTHPSVDAVRVALGNTGSKTTIHRYLRELEEEEGQSVGAKMGVSDALQDLIARLAERLHAEADTVVAQAQARFQAQLQERTQALEQAHRSRCNAGRQMISRLAKARESPASMLRRPNHAFGEAKRSGALPAKLASTVTAGDQDGAMQFKAERGGFTRSGFT